MARRDDDALSWDGDEDPTLDVRPAASTDAPEPVAGPGAVVNAPEPASLPDGWNAVGKGSEAVTGEHDVAAESPAHAVPATAEEEAPAHLGNAALIAVGVLGGIYLLFAIGWLVGGQRLQGLAQFLVTDVVFQVSLWLAVLAPLVWFATVWIVTARKALWMRFVWLGAGIVLLAPWPFVMVGAVGV
ncbi:MAG TPA: DNA polymerase III subunit gamma/tau [Microbacterium sp.]|uniref:DNA polymerase III subunit gamma/tau n=1 Tax=Microbacterium sp. TaxID=51671 RepID=UPI002C080BF4|nr:DNA polymerase III subunit gamma/tau [Microbacterium sp.]HWI29981.1 DNA polymerase III subunit gamma/tau [Microbacterium sp.]